MATILVRNGGFGELWRRHVLRRRRLDVREAGCQVSRACLAGIACQETEITRHRKALHVAFNILEPLQWLRWSVSVLRHDRCESDGAKPYSEFAVENSLRSGKRTGGGMEFTRCIMRQMRKRTRCY